VAEIKSVAGTASFAGELLNHKEVRGLLSDEHFSVDGTQVAAWASMKSFRAKGVERELRLQSTERSRSAVGMCGDRHMQEVDAPAADVGRHLRPRRQTSRRAGASGSRGRKLSEMA
jgi:hypothetical protein